MTPVSEGIGGLILLLLVVGVAFEIYRYIKGHPQALADLKAKVAGLEASASADWAKVHSKLDSITTKVDATHAAALAPVSITMIPASPAPVAAAQTPPLASGSITDKLVPHAPIPAEPPSPATGTAMAPYPPKTSFDSFDGAWGYDSFPANTPVNITITGLPAEKGCVLGWYEVVGGQPAIMGVSATRNGSPLAIVYSSGAGNGGFAQIPPGSSGDTVVVTFIAPVNTAWGMAVKPA